MKRIQTKRSEDEYGPNLSSHFLRENFFPRPRFKVTHENLEAGNEFHSLQRECRVFMLSGRIEFKNTENVLTLTPGEWADLPAGDYRVAVDTESDAALVYVWDIESFE